MTTCDKSLCGGRGSHGHMQPTVNKNKIATYKTALTIGHGSPI